VWRQLFWFGAYPTMWAAVIPALGAVSDVVGGFGRQFSRRREAGAAIAAAAAFAFLGWGSQLYGDSTVSRRLFLVTGLGVLAASAGVLGTWLDTLRRGRPALKLPLFFALGFAAALAASVATLVVLTLSRARTTPGALRWAGSWQTVLAALAVLGLLSALTHLSPWIWGRPIATPVATLGLLITALAVVLAIAAALVIAVQNLTDAALTSSALRLPSTLGTAAWFALGIGAAIFALGVLTTAARRGDRSPVDDPWGLAATAAGAT
jgi:heme/copper-type cytochrome/quinol oxidase subunit 1